MCVNFKCQNAAIRRLCFGTPPVSFLYRFRSRTTPMSLPLPLPLSPVFNSIAFALSRFQLDRFRSRSRSQYLSFSTRSFSITFSFPSYYSLSIAWISYTVFPNSSSYSFSNSITKFPKNAGLFSFFFCMSAYSSSICCSSSRHRSLC